MPENRAFGYKSSAEIPRNPSKELIEREGSVRTLRFSAACLTVIFATRYFLWAAFFSSARAPERIPNIA
jgi:hypothetical protein